MPNNLEITLFSIGMAFFMYYIHTEDNFNPELIRGKRVLVTGASSGIGEHVAYALAKLGTQLVITAEHDGPLNEVAIRCRGLGSESVHTVTADVTNPDDQLRLVEKTVKALGGLDFLILSHHAVVNSDQWWTGSTENITSLQRALNVNFMSYVNLTSLLMTSLESSGGHIGIVSPSQCKHGVPGMTYFCASNYAVQGFYSSLRQELHLGNKGVSVTVAAFDAVFADTSTKGKSQREFSVEDASINLFVRGVWNRNVEADFSKVGKMSAFFNGLIFG